MSTEPGELRTSESLAATKLSAGTALVAAVGAVTLHDAKLGFPAKLTLIKMIRASPRSTGGLKDAKDEVYQLSHDLE